MKNKRKEGPVALFFDPVAVVDLSARLRYTAEYSRIMGLLDQIGRIL